MLSTDGTKNEGDINQTKGITVFLLVFKPISNTP